MQMSFTCTSCKSSSNNVNRFHYANKFEIMWMACTDVEGTTNLVEIVRESAKELYELILTNFKISSCVSSPPFLWFHLYLVSVLFTAPFLQAKDFSHKNISP